MSWGRFLLCLLLGFTGIHRFLNRDFRTGIIYLCTGGLFGIGWLYDVVMLLIEAVTGKRPPAGAVFQNNVLLTAAFIVLIMLAVVGIPRIAGFIAIAGAVLCAPLRRWQTFLKTHLHPVVLPVAVILMLAAATMLMPVPTTENSDAAEPAGTPLPVETAAAATTAPEPSPAAGPVIAEEADYVLNISRKKFHYPDCGSVEQMSDHNRQEYRGTREELIEDGYTPCGNCKP